MKLASRRLLTGCLLIVALLAAAAWGYTQGLVATQPVTPVVLSGADIGFRMIGRKGDTPVGQLVVRINGEWKQVEFEYAARRLSK